MEQTKTLVVGMTGSGLCLGSVIVSRQLVVDWLQMLALIVGIASGLYSLYWTRRINRWRERGLQRRVQREESGRTKE